MNFELHHNCINCTIIASGLHHNIQAHRYCKHIAKAIQANTQTKALSKSLQIRPKRKIVLKNFHGISIQGGLSPYKSDILWKGFKVVG